jgi:hypothetical protein
MNTNELLARYTYSHAGEFFSMFAPEPLPPWTPEPFSIDAMYQNSMRFMGKKYPCVLAL